MTELCFMTATELKTLLDSQQISAVELLEAHAQQIEQTNPILNALVTLDIDGAMVQAQEIDSQRSKGLKLGILAGLPIAIKDLFDTKGMKTTYGSRIFADHIPKSDHAHVKRLRDAGAIILGKSNTPEFAFSGQTANGVFGKTLNPVNLSKTPTGSSGGAASALAAGMVALADGSDFGGSARTPASVTNTVGFRPSNGLVPMYPNLTPHAYFNTAAPMARTVTDIALMLEVMTGGVVKAKGLERDMKGLKIAWNMSPQDYRVSKDIQFVLNSQSQVFEDMGCELKTADPNVPNVSQVHDFMNYFSVQALADSFSEEEQELLGSVMRNRGRSALNFTTQDFMKNSAGIVEVSVEMDRFFETYDLLAWPAMQNEAFGIDQDDVKLDLDWRCMSLAPIAGLPAISVPAGFSQNGIPVGLQLMARQGNDELVLQAAYAFEQATAFGEDRRLDPDLGSKKIKTGSVTYEIH